MKNCNKCNKNKSLEEFGKDKSSKDGKNRMCMSCVRFKALKWVKENPEKRKAQRHRVYIKGKRKAKDQYIRYHYGISIEEFENLFQKQNGVCSICGKPETSKHQRGTLKTLSIDHSHRTGKVRGLLCYNCNRGIGHLQEDVLILKRAIDYLGEHK